MSVLSKAIFNKSVFSSSIFKNAEKQLNNAQSYDEWKLAAIEFDKNKGLDIWKQEEKTHLYDYTSIRSRLDLLRRMRIKRDNHGLLFALNEGLHGNMGGMGHASLHNTAKFGTKQLVTDYVDEIIWALDYLASDEVDNISKTEKRDFFHRASHCYGSTALLLSGAGTLLYYHLGVIKSLLEEGLMPNVLCGSSGGAFVCAFIGTHTDEQVIDFLSPDKKKPKKQSFAKILSLIGTGNLTTERLLGLTSHLIPDLTFQEAFELTGRHINVSIAAAEKHQTSRLMNAMTSPNVYIREALMASSAVPGFFPPVTLAAKNVDGERQHYLPSRRWVDGSVSDDLPTKRLARLYGVNHFVVSQVNPFVLPFLRDTTVTRGVFSGILDMTQHTTTGLINTGAKIWYKPLSKSPWLERTVTILVSIISQKYTGDINIIPDSRLHNPLRLLKLRGPREAQEMINAGEKSTWPKIEMIRNNSRVSKTLHRIIGEYP